MKDDHKDEPISSQPDVLTISSSYDDLGVVRDFVRSFCTRVSRSAMAEEDITHLELAVHEAVTNIIKHAYEGRPGERIEIKAEMSSDSVRFDLCHWGKQFDPDAVKPPSFDGTRDGGFGVYIIVHCVDDVEYVFGEDGKKSIVMKKKLKSKPTEQE